MAPLGPTRYSQGQGCQGGGDDKPRLASLKQPLQPVCLSEVGAKKGNTPNTQTSYQKFLRGDRRLPRCLGVSSGCQHHALHEGAGAWTPGGRTCSIAFLGDRPRDRRAQLVAGNARRVGERRAAERRGGLVTVALLDTPLQCGLL